MMGRGRGSEQYSLTCFVISRNEKQEKSEKFFFLYLNKKKKRNVFFFVLKQKEKLAHGLLIEDFII